jgi:hypothetical protein
MKQKSTSNVPFSPPPRAISYPNHGKRRYDCRSGLRISCALVDDSALMKRVAIQLQHHERHKVYDVSVDAGGAPSSLFIPRQLKAISAANVEMQELEREPRISNRRDYGTYGRQIEDEESQTESAADASDFEDMRYPSPFRSRSRMNLISPADQGHLPFVPSTAPIAPQATSPPPPVDLVLLDPHAHNAFQSHSASRDPTLHAPPPVSSLTSRRSHLDEAVNRLQAHICTIREFCNGLEYQVQFGDPRLLEELEREGAGFLALARRCLQSEGSGSGTSHSYPGPDPLLKLGMFM